MTDLYVLLDDGPIADDDLDYAIDLDQVARTQADRRLLDMGSWLTAMDRRWPLRVTFPTDALA